MGIRQASFTSVARQSVPAMLEVEGEYQSMS
jgi:hypothetical protein